MSLLGGRLKKNICKSCFCEIPSQELLALAKKKFLKGLSTQELMAKAQSEKEKDYIATLALMDLSEKELKKFIRQGMRELEHVFSCRDKTIAVLKSRGVDCRRGICRTDLDKPKQ